MVITNLSVLDICFKVYVPIKYYLCTSVWYKDSAFYLHVLHTSSTYTPMPATYSMQRKGSAPLSEIKHCCNGQYFNETLLLLTVAKEARQLKTDFHFTTLVRLTRRAFDIDLSIDNV